MWNLIAILLYHNKVLFSLKKSYHTSNNSYLEAFKNKLEVLIHFRVELGMNNTLWDHILTQRYIELSAAWDNDKTKAVKISKEPFNTMVFLSNLETLCYPQLINQLPNGYLNGCDEYPKDITLVYMLVTPWKGGTSAPTTPFKTRVFFVQERAESEQDARNSDSGTKTGTANATMYILKTKSGAKVVCIIYNRNHHPNKCLKRHNPKDNVPPLKPELLGNKKYKTLGGAAHTTTANIESEDWTQWDQEVN